MRLRIAAAALIGSGIQPNLSAFIIAQLVLKFIVLAPNAQIVRTGYGVLARTIV